MPHKFKIGDTVKLINKGQSLNIRDNEMYLLIGKIFDYKEEWNRYLVGWGRGKEWWEHEDFLMLS